MDITKMETLEAFSDRIDALSDAWPRPTAEQKRTALSKAVNAMLDGIEMCEATRLFDFMMRTSPPSIERDLVSGMLKERLALLAAPGVNTPY
jgi:hypothetical protein